MEGRSLVPLFEGGYVEERPVFSMELIKNRSFGNPITRGAIAVREGNYKLIYYLKDEKRLLFNLRDDPYETQNLADSKPQVTQRLLRLIKDNLAMANKRITGADKL